MREIVQTYTRDGYTFSLLFKRGNVAIYEQRKRDIVRYVTNKYSEKTSNCQCFTYYTLEAARRKAEELVNRNS